MTSPTRSTRFLTSFAEAAHDRLLAALIRFLVNLVTELEIGSYEQESAEFWRRWSASAGSLRLAMVERLEERDPERLVRGGGRVPRRGRGADQHRAGAARRPAVRSDAGELPGQGGRRLRPRLNYGLAPGG